MKNKSKDLHENLNYLKLPWIRDNHPGLSRQAAQKNWPHADYLSRLIQGETQLRQQRATQRRIKAARFPLIKTLEQFDWSWPQKINRQQVQHHFRLDFIPSAHNLILLGGVGLGKTHLASALGYQACLKGHSVLFASAADITNTLSAAQATQRLKHELRKYLRPHLLILDELGFMPIDKHGSDLLFQVISERYEKGSIVLTSNKSFKSWPSIFNKDTVITSAILDRLLHHADTITLEGKSYRMKDRIEE